MMNAILLIFLLIINLTCVIPVFSQNPEWIVYTSGYEVYALAEEKNDIWVGTTGGLAQIDKSSGTGTFFNSSNSSLPDNWVQSRAKENNGNKWIGTDDGLARFKENNKPIGKTIPKEYWLSQNYPNPFNPSTKIKFALPKPEYVKIDVYNTLGQEIKILLWRTMKFGQYEIEFNGQNLSSGIYFYRIEAGEFQDVKKMILLR